METIYTVEESAAILKMTPQTVRAWLRQDRLRGFKFNREWRIKESDLYNPDPACKE